MYQFTNKQRAETLDALLKALTKTSSQIKESADSIWNSKNPLGRVLLPNQDSYIAYDQFQPLLSYLESYNEFDEIQQNNTTTQINELKTEFDKKKDKLLENCQKSW